MKKQRFDGFVGLSIAEDDKQLLERAAVDSGETLSSFVRRVTKAAAREQLAQAWRSQEQAAV